MRTTAISGNVERERLVGPFGSCLPSTPSHVNIRHTSAPTSRCQTQKHVLACLTAVAAYWYAYASASQPTNQPTKQHHNRLSPSARRHLLRMKHAACSRPECFARFDQTALPTVNHTAQGEAPAQCSTEKLGCTPQGEQTRSERVTSSANQTAEQAKHALCTVGKAKTPCQLSITGNHRV
jgi:hypothetical protein